MAPSMTVSINNCIFLFFVLAAAITSLEASFGYLFGLLYALEHKSEQSMVLDVTAKHN